MTEVEADMVEEMIRGGFPDAAEVLDPARGARDSKPGGDFFTDAGQADHLAQAVLLGAFIWVPEIGWLAWSGTHWQEVHEAEVVEDVKQHIRGRFRTAVRSMGDDDDTSLIDGWRSMLSARRMTAALGLTRGIGGILVRGAALDADRYVLNLADGTLDLRTGHTRPHERGDHLTLVTPTGMGTTGRELWNGFLERVQPDVEIRSFLRRLLGSALLGEVRDHVMPILVGEGANGKGVFRSAVEHALGPYAVEVDPALLVEQKHGRHLTFLLELRGRRVVFCSETSKGARFNEAEMKRLVGGDPIQANKMRRDPITFVPSHTLVMITNHLPNISGDDEAVWRRVLVIPWDVVIPEHERDGELGERLRQAAPAVLAWLHAGWLEYQRIGLSPPDAVRLRTAKYREDNDALSRFINDRCLISPAASVKPRVLFEAWCRWCASEGETPGSEKALSTVLTKRGYGKSSRAWAGIDLYSEDEEPDETDLG